MGIFDSFRSNSSKQSKKMVDFISDVKTEHGVARDLKDIYEPEWKKFTAAWHNVVRRVTNESISTFNTNKGHQLLSKMIAALTARDPKWNVLPMSRDDLVKDSAHILTDYFSWYFYRHNTRRDVIEPSIFDTVLYGTGITQVGFKQSPEEMKKKSSEEQLNEQLEIGLAMAEEGFDDDVISAEIEKITQEAVRTPPTDGHEQNEPGEAYWQYVDAWDFWIAPGYTSIEQAWVGGGWVEKRIVLPLNRAKSDPGYKNRESMKPTNDIDNPRWDWLAGKSENAGSRGRKRKGNGQFIELFERWIAPDPFKNKPGRVIVWSELSDKLHLDIENPYPEIQGFPFEATHFKKRKGDFWGIPYLEHLSQTLDAYDLMRSYELDVAKTIKPIMVGQKGLHDEADTEALSETPSGSVLLLNNPQGFTALQFPGASPELLNEVRQLTEDLALGSGLGAPVAGANSATEASIIQTNTTGDIQNLTSRINASLVNSGRKFLKITQTKGNPEDVLRASNAQNRQYTEFTRADIEGEFDLRIGMGMSIPGDAVLQRKQQLDLIIGLGNAFPGQIRTNRALVDLFELFDLPSPQDYVVDNEGRDQNLETAIMIKTKENVEVLPSDEHALHIQEATKFLNILQQDAQAMQEAAQQGQEVDEQAFEETAIDIQNLSEHIQMHQSFLPANQGGGNAPLANNPTPTVGNQLQATLGAQ